MRPRPPAPRAGTPLVTRLTSVRNARDLAGAFAHLPPGRLLRSACPAGAAPDDVALLRRAMGIASLIDLRADEERERDPRCLLLHADDVFTMPFDRAAAAWPPAQSTSGLTVHQISVLDRERFYRALLRRVPKRTAVAAFALNLVSPPRAKRLAVAAINAGGLCGMYVCMLDSAAPEFAASASALLAAAAARSPLLFFCRVGKDRTGLFAALVLSLLGATEEAIIADYVLSDNNIPSIALGGMERSGRELDGLDTTLFARAPADAMRGALAHLEEAHGGASAYLAAGGFPPSDQARLVAALTAPATPGGGGGYGDASKL